MTVFSGYLDFTDLMNSAASSTRSFDTNASVTQPMEMSFGSALAADAPVYRAFSGGPPPPPPGLTKQNAFVREMPE